MVRLKAMTSKVGQRGTCEKILQWEIETASHDQKGKYEIAPEPVVFECLKPEDR